MAANKLDGEQRLMLLEWLAAGYTCGDIQERLRRAGLPELSAKGILYYRKRYRAEFERVRQERHDQAMLSGLALQAERVTRLCEYAARLEALMLAEKSRRGRLLYGKAWRETLNAIAREMERYNPPPPPAFKYDKDYGDFDPDLMWESDKK